MKTVKKLAMLAARNPRLAFNKVRTTWRTEYLAKLDYKFRNGYASAPTSVALKLTNACNLRCKMCGQPREGHVPGDAKYAPASFFKERVSIARYKDILTELKKIRPNIYLWGGEPFIYPDLFELVRYGKSLNFTVQINTNGLYVRKYAEEIVACGLDDLIVSIDGPEEVHDDVRGLAGAFRLLKEGIVAIQAEKKSRGRKHPLLRVRGTISPYNFEHIYTLTDIAKELGADSLNFNWTWFTTRQTGEAYQKMMKELFDTDARSWIPYETEVILDPDKDRKYDGIKTELARFSNNSTDLPISMSPFIKPEQVETYYENIYETFGHETCYAVYSKSYILPNGDVTPCPDFPDYICGNINDDHFLDIWNGERYRQWRLELKRRRLFPSCYRCCDLFLSDVRFI
ncbi:radical SAM protein [candidate division KSB1 bacterium]|nr:radical SAM protein [candidate division KSB1 bacterium]